MITDLIPTTDVICVGDDAEFTTTIRNDGTGPSGEFALRKTYDGSEFDSIEPSLDPGESRIYRETVQAPSLGEHTLAFRVDPGNLIVEPNETNNQATITFTVETCDQLEIDYFALGDSVASGHGLASDRTACERSLEAYPYKVAAELGTRYDVVHFENSSDETPDHFFACSGATALGDGEQQVPDQALAVQVARVRLALTNIPSNRPVLVSITIGMNDLGWTDPVEVLRLIRLSDVGYINFMLQRTAAIAAEVKEQVELLLAYENVTVVITDYHNPFNQDSRVFSFADRFLKIFSRDVPGLFAEPCTDWALIGRQMDCYQRAEHGIHLLNTALVVDVVGSLSSEYPGRIGPAGVHEAFHGDGGHESPRRTCGNAPPNAAQSWVQYPGYPNANGPVPPILRLILGNWNANGGDCFHPNRAGAIAFASAVDARTILLGR